MYQGRKKEASKKGKHGLLSSAPEWQVESGFKKKQLKFHKQTAEKAFLPDLTKFTNINKHLIKIIIWQMNVYDMYKHMI